MLAEQVYHTASRISYRASDISLKSAINCGMMLTKKGECKMIGQIVTVTVDRPIGSYHSIIPTLSTQ